MRKLILQEWISLDGYVADKKGQLDFFTGTNAELNKYLDQDQLKFMDDIDTILLGRRTYDLFVGFWPSASTDQEIIADKLNTTRKLVFSTTLDKAPWGKWPDAQVIKGEAADAIQHLKTKEGKHMVLWGSISLAQSLMHHNLIGEYHLHVCPTITGGGRPLFPGGDARVDLDLIGLQSYDTGVVSVHYAPRS